METRISVKKDKDKIKELWKNANYCSQGFSEWFFENAFVPENTVISTDCGQVVASFSVTPKKLNLSGFEAEAAYVSGLCVLPEYRTDENIKNQLTNILATVFERDYLLSVTVPQNYRLCEQFGWRTAYDYKQYDIKTSDIPPYPIKDRVVRPDVTSETIAVLSGLYKEFTLDKNAYAIRSESDWKLILEDLYCNFGGRCILFYDSENNPVGYMLMILRDKKMGVYEFAYKNRSAYESMMGFIRQHEIENISIKVPACDMGYLDFCDNRSAVTLHTFAMARVSDARKALAIASSKLEESFKIQIIDRLIEGNNKTFILGSDLSETDEEADVITDIGTLTQLFMGYISVDEASKMNLVSGDAKRLKKIFGKKNNYINMLLI